MSERNGTTLGTGTAEIPVVRATAAPTPVPGPQDEAPEPNVVADGDMVPGMQPTAPVTVRPTAADAAAGAADGDGSVGAGGRCPARPACWA